MLQPTAVRRVRPRPLRFTLVELLVVIAIVAMLASMLLPALASAREKGRAAACLNNVKDLELASISYASENDDRTPKGYQGINWWRGTWKEVLFMGYLGHETDTFYCPTMQDPKTGTVAGSPRGWAGVYGINPYVTETSVEYPNCVGWVKRARINKPEATISTGENKDGDWVCEPQQGQWGSTGICAAPHNQRTNFAFYDGHAAPMTVEDSHATKNGQPFWYFQYEKAGP